MAKYIVCNRSGGGVTVEEGKGDAAKLVKKLPGESVDLPKEVADDLLDKGIIKPVTKGDSE